MGGQSDVATSTGVALSPDEKLALSIDDAELAAMGYQPVLRRAVSVLPSVALVFGGTVLSTGGPDVMIWGWIFVSFFTIIVACSMGEICSSYPSAGSVYHWAGQLAPERWAPLVAYITGWFNFIGNAAGDAAFAYGFANYLVVAQQIDSCPKDINQLYQVASQPGYRMIDTSSTSSSTSGPYMVDAAIRTGLGLGPVPGPAPGCHTYNIGVQVGISMAVCFAWAVLNLVRVDIQGWFQNSGMLFQVAGIVVIAAVMLSGSHGHASSNETWEIWRNRTGMYENLNINSSFGYVILLGLSGSLFIFSGYEAGAHMAEETVNASFSSAWGIIVTVCCIAAAGFLLILSLLYSIPPQLGVHTALTTYSANPVASLFAVVRGNAVGGALTKLVVAQFFFAGTASLTVTARIAFAMARDGAIPFGKPLAYVSPLTKTPVGAVLLTLALDCAILLLPLTTWGADTQGAGPIAYNTVTSITVIGFQISYAIPIFCRALQGKNFVSSTFSLGRAGTFVAWIAALFLSLTACILFWPISFPVKKTNMNYTVVVVGGLAFFMAIHWVVSARHTFKGPVRVDAHEFKRIKAVYEQSGAAKEAAAPRSATIHGESHPAGEEP